MTKTEIVCETNPRVQNAMDLRQRSNRLQYGTTLIEGRADIQRAIDVDIVPHEVFVCETSLSEPQLAAWLEQLLQLGVLISPVSKPVFDRLVDGTDSLDVVAVVSTPQTNLFELCLSKRPLVAVLVGEENPETIGAVLRNASEAGADAVVAANCQTDLFDPAVIRASHGAIFNLPTCSASCVETLGWLRTIEVLILVAQREEAPYHTELDLTRDLAIVLGSDSGRLSGIWHAEDIQPVCLPEGGDADCRNVPSTASTLFSEALRQREL